ncbi:MAG: hypothetical protein P4L93_08690 [Coriobacteriia bacterium]|nr:hypothetical protein [Coriobacteriia bacterium]
MECVTAQQVISTALDREPVDSYQLEEAKEHCRTCPECGLFVRAQLVAQQVGLPEPPADLADRVIARVRTEAADAAAAAQAEAAQAEAASAEYLRPAPAQGAPAQPPGTLAPKPRTARKLPRMWVSAAAAAAVIVALLGTGAIVVFGMREMSAPPQTASQIYQGAPQVADSGATAASSTPQGAAKVTGAQAITVGGMVYKEVGASKLDSGTISVVGSTNSSLGGASVAKRDVYAKTSAIQDTSVYVADDTGQLFQFAPVTRSYAGLTFVLESSELTSFDQWPALPAQITPPTTDDGQPTFVYDGTDSSGVRVYRQTNSTVTQGIAIAPGTPAKDPAAGNPNWTWWSPQR